MIEDAVVIYRINWNVERRIFKIDEVNYKQRLEQFYETLWQDIETNLYMTSSKVK